MFRLAIADDLMAPHDELPIPPCSRKLTIEQPELASYATSAASSPAVLRKFRSEEFNLLAKSRCRVLHFLPCASKPCVPTFLHVRVLRAHPSGLSPSKCFPKSSIYRATLCVSRIYLLRSKINYLRRNPLHENYLHSKLHHALAKR